VAFPGDVFDVLQGAQPFWVMVTGHALHDPSAFKRMSAANSVVVPWTAQDETGRTGTRQ
jgi:hypothetical protein